MTLHRQPSFSHHALSCRSKQQTQAHLTLCVGGMETADEDDYITAMVAKKSVVFCASPGDGDSVPAATETFFAFPFIEDFIDQQTPAEHKHRAMSRCRCSVIPRSRSILTHTCSSVVSADRTLKPDSQVRALHLGISVLIFDSCKIT